MYLFNKKYKKMDQIKNLYDKLFLEENEAIKKTAVFTVFLVICFISCIFLIMRNTRSYKKTLNYKPAYFSPKKINTRIIPPKIKKTNPSPPKNTGYLIRKKPGYTDQSPRKKTYPTRFKISSVLR